MEKIKKYIIILLCIIIIIIFFMILINNKKNNSSSNLPFNDKERQDLLVGEIKKEDYWQEETSFSHYYAIKNILDNYYNNMSKYKPDYLVQLKGVKDNNILKEETQKEKIDVMQELKEMLSIYINSKKIDDLQLEEMFRNHSEENVKMNNLFYKKEDNSSIILYYLDIVEVNTEENRSIIIIVDNITDAYTILPIEYLNDNFGKSYEISQVDIKTNMLKIEKKVYNIVKYEKGSNQEKCIKYFGDYLYNIKTNIKKAYGTLNEEYVSKRFESYEDFKKYIENQKEIIKSAYLVEYDISQSLYNDEVTYICKDQYENYYIFKATSVMNYTVILDNHTIDLPEFTQKYNSSTKENKVAMNLEKIRDALNTKDYQFIYNKLDNTFKQNNYPSLAHLESFIKSNLFDLNEFKYEKVQEDSGLYIAKVTISDSKGKESKKVNLNVIMQLKDGTDFVMSFSVE